MTHAFIIICFQPTPNQTPLHYLQAPPRLPEGHCLLRPPLRLLRRPPPPVRPPLRGALLQLVRRGGGGRPPFLRRHRGLRHRGRGAVEGQGEGGRRQGHLQDGRICKYSLGRQLVMKVL